MLPLVNLLAAIALLVLGANIGSRVLAMISIANASPQVRWLQLGTLIFNVSGALLFVLVLPQVHALLQQLAPDVHEQVVYFHFGFNVVPALLFIGFTGLVGRTVERWLREPSPGANTLRPRHLDQLALTMSSLAISCAAREALHQADVVGTMLRGIVPVIRNNGLRLSSDLRKLDDVVDELYSAIKFYLMQIPREALSQDESRRWTDILSFTINMEQIGDIIERILQDLEDKMVRKNRSFSDAGTQEIVADRGGSSLTPRAASC